MRHSEKWHHDLAEKLGHPGFLTLAEIKKAEREEEAEETVTLKFPGFPAIKGIGPAITAKDE